MLPNTFNDTFQAHMNLKLQELKKESSYEYLMASEEAARRGQLTSSTKAGLHNQADIHLIEKCVTAIVELQKDLITGLQIPFNDTLAADLKDQVKSYVSPDWCEELYKMNLSGISKQHAARLKEELCVNRNFFLKRAEAQIDFLVDTLRTQLQSRK